MSEQARRSVKAHFAALPARYSLSVEPADVLVHMKLMVDARRTQQLQAHVLRHGGSGGGGGSSGDGGGGGALVVVACRDRGDLLDAITRALRRVARRICDADVMTSHDGVALDRFEVVLAEEHAALPDEALVRILQDAVVRDAAARSGGGAPAAPPLSATAWAQQPLDAAGGGSGGGGGAIAMEELEMLEVVGRGRFTALRRALWRGAPVAVKCVAAPPAGDAERAHDRALILGEFQRELDIVRRLRHRHVCRFYGAAVAPPLHCLVFEFIEGGNLAEYLRGGSSGGDGGGGDGGAAAAAEQHREALRLAEQIAEGMAYLHARGVLHRDLKPANLLLDARGDVRIVDFGLSCFNHPGADLTAETGTYRWMAPEVIRHEPYSAAADVYSYGIVLWELLARAQPFEGLTPIQAAFAVARKGLRPTLPPRAPPPLAALVRRCWAAQPQARPAFDAIERVLLPEVRAAMGL
ncbi:putative serine/threonine protein kinase [Tribonema minus]|uniref:Putative serine/threonine protein kinase n=1 Tax=Tribonema minus TaxID=303371 RepID=A0A835ZBB1_9STRA|nr:putative serine/threonine protein kinase [Tribonema minus]